MKEYKIIEAPRAERAEYLMNEMAKEGWEVVGMTYWEGFSRSLLITLSREKQE